MTGYVISFAWGLVVLAALIGWGGVVARLFGETDWRVDWGLAAGWGMALVLAFGGVLALAGLARPWALVALVVAGAALFARDVRAGPTRWPADRRVRWLLALAAAALLARYASAVSHQAMACNDDNIAYFAFVARLLDTGTLIEPFSLRRLTAFGGQTFLQALAMVAGDADNGYLIDRGVAVIVAFGLALGFFRDPNRGGAAGLRPAHVLVALLLTVILPLPLMNSSSHVTGLAMVLTLFRTLQRTPARPWLLGLVAAGAMSLKVNFMAMAAATLVAWWLIGVWRQRGDWRRHGREALHLAGATAAFLAPWMALLHLSSATPLFPLFRGNHRPGFEATYSGDLPFTELAAFVGNFLIQPQIGIFLLPLLLYAFGHGGRAGLAIYAAAVATAVATAATLTYSGIQDLHRFVAPFLNAAFIATVLVFVDAALRATPAGDGTRARRAGSAALWVMVLALLPVPVWRDANRIAATWGQTVLSDADADAYARAQAAVPAGAALLVMVKHPFAFDFARNRIVNVDVPGAASPEPGMPFFRGPGPLKEYLASRSIRHVAFRDFSAPGACLYGRDIWRWYATGDRHIWRAHSRYYLDLMDNLDALAAGARIVHRDRVLTVIALE